MEQGKLFFLWRKSVKRVIILGRWHYFIPTSSTIIFTLPLSTFTTILSAWKIEEWPNEAHECLFGASLCPGVFVQVQIVTLNPMKNVPHYFSGLDFLVSVSKRNFKKIGVKGKRSNESKRKIRRYRKKIEISWEKISLQEFTKIRWNLKNKLLCIIL